MEIYQRTFRQFMEEYLSNPENRKAYEEHQNSIQCKVHHALVRERIKRGITHKQLAKSIGVSQRVLERIVTGDGRVRFSVLQKVTSALGLKLMVV